MALASFGARLAIVAVIVAAGGVLTGLLYNDVSSSETQLSKLSFKGALLSQLTNFEAFIVGQLRSIRALSDAMSLRNSVPTPEEFERVSCVVWGATSFRRHGIPLYVRDLVPIVGGRVADVFCHLNARCHRSFVDNDM
jgi:hypothetical protein